MAEDTAALVATLQVRLQDMERGMKQAGVLAEKAVRDIEDRFARANPTIDLGGLGRSFSAGLGIGAFSGITASVGAIVARFVEANKEIASFEDTARRAGVALREFQELRYAGQTKGISGADFDAGVTSLADKLAAAKYESGELGKLLEDNGRSIKDNAGNVISLNDALQTAADLIQNAANESERVKIAEAFGLNEKFLDLLRQGGDALSRLVGEAGSASAAIDEKLVAQAKEFKKEWESAALGASTAFRGWVAEAEGLVAGLIAKVRHSGAEFRQSFPLLAEALGSPADKVGDKAFNGINPDGTLQDRAPLAVTVRPRKSTDVSALYKRGGSSGSSGESEEDRRYDQIQRYVEQLEKTSRVLEAEKNSIGLSNAERAKAIELARIGAVTDEEQLKRLNEAIDKNEQLRLSIEAQKKARQALNEATKFSGQLLTDALMDAVVNGEKLDQVAQNIAKSLAQAALQAALMGSGPLAGTFGTAGSNGQAGGIFGSLFRSLGSAFGTPSVAAASGGRVSGPGTGTSDSISAWLSNGEYVVNSAATRRYLPLLDEINSGRIPRFASGGMVGGGSAPRLPAIPSASQMGSGGRHGQYLVNIQNNAPADVQTQQSQTSNGPALEIMIAERINQHIMSGGADKSARQRWGLNAMRGR